MQVVVLVKAGGDKVEEGPSGTAVQMTVRLTCLSFGIGKPAAQHGLSADAPAGALKIAGILTKALPI